MNKNKFAEINLLFLIVLLICSHPVSVMAGSGSQKNIKVTLEQFSITEKDGGYQVAAEFSAGETKYTLEAEALFYSFMIHNAFLDGKYVADVKKANYEIQGFSICTLNDTFNADYTINEDEVLLKLVFQISDTETVYCIQKINKNTNDGLKQLLAHPSQIIEDSGNEIAGSALSIELNYLRDMESMALPEDDNISEQTTAEDETFDVEYHDYQEHGEWKTAAEGNAAPEREQETDSADITKILVGCAVVALAAGAGIVFCLRKLKNQTK